jgi:DNA mismatch repair protein MutS
MKVKEWQEQIIFLHKISQGSANNSYGIHVAKIAGLPLEVTLRAKGILQLLTHAKSNSSLPLFNKAINNNWQKKLEKINLAEITHAEAINLLTSIKEDVS